RTGMPFAQAMCHLTTARALFERGEHETAAKHLASTRVLGREMGSRYIEYLCLLAAAKAALDRRDEGPGMQALREAIVLGRTQGFWTHMWLPTADLVRLCVIALEHGIEVDYVRELIRRRELLAEGVAPGVEAWPWPVRILTLGRFEVLIHDRRLTFSGKAQKKPLALLQALIALGGRGVREELLMDALWPDAEGDAAARALTTTVHRLRRLLGPEAISRQGGHLGVDPRRCWVDVWALEHWLTRADAADQTDERARLLERAAALDRGPFLPGEMREGSARLRERIRGRLERLSDTLRVAAAPQGGSIRSLPPR
ncbi:MAG TPA: winged helix-turn-helix domain-containing protein, partial [Myxococcales bacterium]